MVDHSTSFKVLHGPQFLHRYLSLLYKLAVLKITFNCNALTHSISLFAPIYMNIKPNNNSYNQQQQPPTQPYYQPPQQPYYAQPQQPAYGSPSSNPYNHPNYIQATQPTPQYQVTTYGAPQYPPPQAEPKFYEVPVGGNGTHPPKIVEKPKAQVRN
jgi:hypothetical protein